MHHAWILAAVRGAAQPVPYCALWNRISDIGKNGQQSPVSAAHPEDAPSVRPGHRRECGLTASVRGLSLCAPPPPVAAEAALELWPDGEGEGEDDGEDDGEDGEDDGDAMAAEGGAALLASSSSEEGPSGEGAQTEEEAGSGDGLGAADGEGEEGEGEGAGDEGEPWGGAAGAAAAAVAAAAADEMAVAGVGPAEEGAARASES